MAGEAPCTIKKIVRNGQEYQFYTGGQYISKTIFGDGSCGDCVFEYDDTTKGNVFIPVDDYCFNNLTICPGVKLRFCGEGTPIIRVKGEFKNEGELWLRNPFIQCTTTTYFSDLGVNVTTTKNDHYSTAVACYNAIFARVGDPSQGRGGKAGSIGSCTNILKGGDGGSAGCSGCSGCNGAASNGGCGGASQNAYSGGGGGGGGANTSWSGIATATNGGNGGVGNTGGCGGNGGNGATTVNTCNCCGIYGGTGGGGGYGLYKGGDGGDGGHCGIQNIGGYFCKCRILAGGDGGDSYYGAGGKGGNGHYAYSCYAAPNYPHLKGGDGGWSFYGNGGTGGMPGGAGGSTIFGTGGNVGAQESVYGYNAAYNAGESIYGKGGNGPTGACCGKGGNGLDGGCVYNSCCGGGPTAGIAYGGAYGIGIFAKTFCLSGQICGRGGNAGNGCHCVKSTPGANIYIVTGKCYVCTGCICNSGGTGGAGSGAAGILCIKNTQY